jgi:hypothetical protein
VAPTGGGRHRRCTSYEMPASIALLRGGAVEAPSAAAARSGSVGAALHSAARQGSVSAGPPSTPVARQGSLTASPPSATTTSLCLRRCGPSIRRRPSPRIPPRPPSRRRLGQRRKAPVVWGRWGMEGTEMTRRIGKGNE